MTRSNRTLNRIVLALVGLVAVASGLTLGALVLRSTSQASGTLGRLALPDRLVLPRVDGSAVTPGALWTAVAACAVVAVAALCWAATRGRGGSAVALREEYDTGRVTINVALLRDVVEHELRDVADVVGTRVDTARVRSGHAVRIRIALRRGGDAVGVLRAADGCVDTLDTVLGRRLPVLLHVTGGIRSATTAARRVR